MIKSHHVGDISPTSERIEEDAIKFQQRDTVEERDSVIVSSLRFPFQNEMNIYGNKVAFIHFKKDEPLIGIMIAHPNIAQTMKALFDLAWQGSLTTKLHTNNSS